MLIYRSVALAAAFAFPLTGLAVWGLTGAIWGVAAHSVVLGAFAAMMVQFTASRSDRLHPPAIGSNSVRDIREKEEPND
jgi:hypothetical protein